jgi:hypothetical protein
LSVFFLTFCASPHCGAAQIWAGLNATQFSYKELGNGVHESIENGLLPFFLLGYRTWTVPGHVLQIKSEFLYDGSTDFSGTDATTAENISATDFHRFYDIEVRYDVDMKMGFWVFAGLGRRMWDRTLSYGAGYREVYQWNYLSVGVRGNIIEDLAHWRLGWEVALKPTFGGQLEVYFSETLTDGQDSGFSLGARTGQRGALSAEKLEAYFLGLRPRIEFWLEQTEIGASNWVFNGTPAINNQVQEPSSRTLQLGLLISAKKDF